MNGTATTTENASGTVAGALTRIGPATPAWVDLRTRAGTATAARFYCSLFGWSVVARHRPLDDQVGCWTFREGDRIVGGLAPADESSWTLYLAVDDVDAAVEAVVANGGEVLAGPTTVTASVRCSGRMALCADPLGARFAVWCPDSDAASDDRGPSAYYQLARRDVDVAMRFYTAVFGWITLTTLGEDGSTYTALVHPVTGRTVATMVQVTDRRHDHAPAQWMAHFSVTDAEEATVRATELGATVTVAPFDLPRVGRVAVITDPENVTFSVLQAA